MDRTGENEKDNGEPQLHDTSVAVPVLVIGGLLRSFASPMVGSVRRVSVAEWVRN